MGDNDGTIYRHRKKIAKPRPKEAKAGPKC